jgi:hypothetical protein
MRKQNDLKKKPLALDTTTIREISSDRLVVANGARAGATSSGYLCC